jgi:poly(U)-specific endoribonuclease
MATPDIYHQIWESDANKLSVSARYGTRDWADPHADILLDEQVHPSPDPTVDLAPRPLFYRVNDEKVRSRPTYHHFIQLLDNYQAHIHAPEITTRAEKAEIQRFLEAILVTAPLEHAFHYITQSLQFSLAWDTFADRLYDLWFKPHTHTYRGQVIADASGFEHTFVGEGRYARPPVRSRTAAPRFNSPEAIAGSISGYHSWIKLYLDEKGDRVNFLGYNYGLHGQHGSRCPYVIIVQMEWSQPHPDGTVVKLFKKSNSFFVGTSPECEVAMGTVAFYESLRHKLVGNRRRAQIHSLSYDLILNRSLNADGTLGDHIHSFYPLFVGNGTTQPPAPS